MPTGTTYAVDDRSRPVRTWNEGWSIHTVHEEPRSSEVRELLRRTTPRLPKPSPAVDAVAGPRPAHHVACHHAAGHSHRTRKTGAPIPLPLTRPTPRRRRARSKTRLSPRCEQLGQAAHRPKLAHDPLPRRELTKGGVEQPTSRRCSIDEFVPHAAVADGSHGLSFHGLWSPSRFTASPACCRLASSSTRLSPARCRHILSDARQRAAPSLTPFQDDRSRPCGGSLSRLSLASPTGTSTRTPKRS